MRLQKQGSGCLDSRGRNHYGIDISAIMARMATKTCRVMCKDMMDMLDKGFDDYSNVLAGNANANQSGTAARTAGAASTKRMISRSSWIL